MDRKLPHIVSLLVIGTFAWYYLVFRAMPLSIGFANAIVAFSAVIILGLAFFLGPLARFVKFFDRFLVHRKAFGLWGFSLAALHVALAAIVLLSERREISFADVMSLAVAAIAFMIFTLMAFTSTAEWVQKLGYENWKNLQRTGYVAMAMLLLHILLLENGVFLSRLTGQIAMAFILLVLLLRGAALLLSMESRQKIDV
ncbi:MAG: ferric reductase-like transmembrane domain-containing protein [Candidatus Diapherotrites archaeon]|nr:ferric reductase-like transmembrane domain-containing protein [Candidatus Diapherotrites archaeon]